MDTSKEYIKMCEKAEEIQNWRIYAKRGVVCEFESGDFIYHKETYAIETFKKSTPNHDCDYLPEEHIWLPRQDQLQEMLLNKDYIFKRLLVEFSIYIANQENAEPLDRGLISMEQLWLAFVMKEKFKKMWDGELWK